VGDGLAGGDADLDHLRVLRGLDRVRHLHGLELGHELAGGDAVAGRDVHGDDRARHRRRELGAEAVLGQVGRLREGGRARGHERRERVR